MIQKGSASTDESYGVVRTTIGQLLRNAALEAPDSLALVEGTSDRSSRRRLTFRQMYDMSEEMARALLGRFRPGEHIAVWSGNSVEWQLLQYATALAGLTLVTVNPAYKPRELAYVLRQSKAVGVFMADSYRDISMPQVLADAGDIPQLREVLRLADWDQIVDTTDSAVSLPEVQPEDPAMIQYTSGTTGPPKGAMLTHLGVCNTSRMIGLRSGGMLGDVWLNPLPLFHVGSCVWSSLGTLWPTATHVLVPTFSPTLLLQLIEEEGVTSMTSVPTVLIGMLEDPTFAERDLTSLTMVISGGSTVPAPLVRRVEETFDTTFGIVFGQTELSGVCCMTLPDDTIEDKAETVGRPLPETQMRVVDPNTGEAVPVGEQGEICVRSFGAMHSYFDMPDATSETIDEDGWLHSGDLGVVDERGYVRITGRLKDMIIRGGENIYPREIEDCLFEHPGVIDVAVIGVPDERWGEQVAAFVRASPTDRPTVEELNDFVLAHLAAHKRPRYWEFVESFPLTPSGKIQKFQLRAEFEAREVQKVSSS